MSAQTTPQDALARKLEAKQQFDRLVGRMTEGELQKE